MDCKHDIKDLEGRADGIHCLKCGKVFESLDELKPAETQPKPKKKAGKKND